jgi:hypothetical protein
MKKQWNEKTLLHSHCAFSIGEGVDDILLVLNDDKIAI